MRKVLLLAIAAVVAVLSVSVSGASAGVTTVTLAGSGTGTVSSDPAGIACSNVAGAVQNDCVKDWLLQFGVAELTATPGPGSSFVGWSGTAGQFGGMCAGGTNPCQTPSLFASFTATATFAPTPDRPAATTGDATRIAFPSATVSGTINPNSADFSLSECYFEYGVTTDYGERARCRPGNIAAGTSPVAVTASIGVLEPGLTYHYRLVAANGAGATRGADRTLDTATAPTDPCPNAAIRAQQGALAQRLPDCRAYELASPPFAGGQGVKAQVASADGNRVRLMSVGGFAGTEFLSILGTSYVGERTRSGWTVSPMAPAGSTFPYIYQWDLIDMTREMDRGLWFVNLPGDEGTTRFTPIVREADGSIQVAGGAEENPSQAPGASADLRTIVQRTTTRLPTTDGTIDSRSASRGSLYASTHEAGSQLSIRQVAHRNGATMFPACEVQFGGVSTSGSHMAGRNTVSQDGRRIFFTFGAGTGCNAASTRRVWAKIGAADPVDLSASQCTSTTCGTTTPAPANFRGAARDGSRVYFSTTQRLLPEDQDTSAQNDIYEYDFNATGQRLRLVTGSSEASGANVAASGLFRVSEDGAYVYFIATGRPLTTTPNARGVVPASGDNNVYVYHRARGAASGTTTFVGALATLEIPPMQLSSDGRYSVFTTTADLTGARLVGDTYPDLFRYDARNDELSRVWSRSPDHNGAARRGAAVIDGSLMLAGAGSLSAAGASVSSGGWEISQAVSDDGSLVGFTTSEPLSADDRNDFDDAYLWDATTGRLTMLTDGTAKPRNPWDAAGFSGMTPSGDSLFVRSTSPLVAAHDNGQVAVYAVRRGGGFLEAPTLADRCAGDACQPPASPPPALGGADGSSTFTGPGSVLLDGPKAAATVRVGRAKPVRGSSTRISVRVSTAGTVRVAGGNLARTSKSIGKAGSVSVAVRLTKSGQRTLQRRGSVRTRATVRFVPADGKATTARVSVTFRAKRKKSKVAASSRSSNVLASNVQKGR